MPSSTTGTPTRCQPAQSVGCRKTASKWSLWSVPTWRSAQGALQPSHPCLCPHWHRCRNRKPKLFFRRPYRQWSSTSFRRPTGRRPDTLSKSFWSGTRRDASSPSRVGPVRRGGTAQGYPSFPASRSPLASSFPSSGGRTRWLPSGTRLCPRAE